MDWRFLLPQPSPEKSVCFADGLLADAVKLISRRTVEPQSRGSEDCDLAVAVDPREDTIRRALAHLRPGGSLYLEFHPRILVRPRATSRRLERAGFEKTVCYRPWPSVQTPVFWAPLGSAAIQRYLHRTRGTRRTFVSRAKHLLSHLKWLVKFRLTLELPLCVIARKLLPVSAHPLEEMLPSRSSASEAFCSWGHPVQLLITGGSRTVSKVVRLVFEEPRPEPVLAIKMARVPESASALAREASCLNAIHSILGGTVDGIPRVLFKTDAYGSFTLGQTAIAAVPMFSDVDRRNYRQFALKATDWLICLAHRRRTHARDPWWTRLIQPVVKEFEAAYSRVTDPELLEQAKQVISEIQALPLVCEHRDFAPWNVLLAPKGELAVLDWESAEPHGLPALDLIYFLTYLAFRLDRVSDVPSYLRSYRTALDQTTFTGAVHLECLQRYARAVNLCVSYLHPLRLLTWMIHSRSEYQRLLADFEGEPATEALRSALFFNLWKEQLSAQR